MVFIFSWNEFFFSLILTTNNAKTFPVLVREGSRLSQIRFRRGHALLEVEVDDLLVVGGRDDDGAEVGGVLVEGPADVGVAALGRQVEVPPGVLQGGRVDVDRGHHLDAALLHARREELLAPGGPEPARAHLDHLVAHAALQPRDQPC